MRKCRSAITKNDHQGSCLLQDCNCVENCGAKPAAPTAANLISRWHKHCATWLGRMFRSCVCRKRPARSWQAVNRLQGIGSRKRENEGENVNVASCKCLVWWTGSKQRHSFIYGSKNWAQVNPTWKDEKPRTHQHRSNKSLIIPTTSLQRITHFRSFAFHKLTDRALLRPHINQPG